ncbi:hypothetical protein [Streptomyces sp. IMTB 2501]|nr:hypothetical protein [Streptomyces sp. IMTB 2501]
MSRRTKNPAGGRHRTVFRVCPVSGRRRSRAAPDARGAGGG